MKSLVEHVTSAITPRLYDRMDEYAIRAVARIAVEAAFENVAANQSPEMIAAGWSQLKRAHLPRLGAGPGLQEAFRAMISKALEEMEAGQ